MLSRIPAESLVLLLSGYRRWISPMFGPHCRFHPSCSAYAITALHHHGLLRGGWLTLRRLLKCQPFFPGGEDPVPPPRVRQRRSSSPPSPRPRPRGALR